MTSFTTLTTSSVRTAALIFPHQLFSDHPVLREDPEKVLLVEDTLFFGDSEYPLRVHGQKLVYHRETMAAYAESLKKTTDIDYRAWTTSDSQIEPICREFSIEGIQRIVVCDVHDYLLQKRLSEAAAKHSLKLEVLPTPMFLNLPTDNADYRNGRKRWFMADFYQWQRRRLNILMNDKEPKGGRWSFDNENRKKLPKRMVIDLPRLPVIGDSAIRKTGVESVSVDFPSHLGAIDDAYYPSSHQAAAAWLDTFLEQRFEHFGSYEDAIVQGQNWLYHSVLTPMLNIGLLTPEQIIERSLSAAESFGTPINSVEGFIRQIIGWREFMRATYVDLGINMRTTNHWGHHRAMPSSFYSATTGIDPVDDTISRVLETGYCHHIERLMILGGFMFLCEIDPDDIYRWFMELFIDSYDWVMVPNVYAMSQNADGGLITTKPYFSGSNYVIKMSHYKKGQWSELWDALFWRWIFLHKDSLSGNPRWAMMCRNAERMDPSRAKSLQKMANDFLDSLDA